MDERKISKGIRADINAKTRAPVYFGKASDCNSRFFSDTPAQKKCADIIFYK